jgi:IS1 family transposase
MKYQDKHLRNLPCRHIQADEIWSFCYAKAKNVPEAKRGEWGYGDVWTWTAMCSDCKLVPSWLVATRDGHAARVFIQDLADRMANRIQLTTDGHRVYLDAVEQAFGSNIDYSMLVKVYGSDPEAETRYSPAVCISAIPVPVNGDPKLDRVSTSHVERLNLTARMAMRRFTRLTNAFSKKVENLEHAVALHFMYYNFGRVHQTLRVTPAMEAGISTHLWSLEEIAALADGQEPASK